ncbi:hypothetical protein ABZ916_09455 [Streptomyces sp. NPDC046853]|uniref:hypothetical protein n=1 Tax=Streptomyces sp. NPDC046853 TaxID=3154920 RepID=UPI0033CAE727
MSLDDHGYEISQLDNRVDDLERDVRSLKDKFGYTEDLDEELRQLRSGVSDADDKADEVSSNLDGLDRDVRSHISDTLRSVQQLTARIQVIEAHLAKAGTMPRADFDTVPASWQALAQVTARTREVRADLLDYGDRHRSQSRIRSYQEAVDTRDEAYSRVLDATQALASTGTGTDAHTQAVRDLSTARHQAQLYSRQAQQRSGAASQARRLLAADEQARSEHADLLQEGAKAEQKLFLAVRSRISEAVRDRALLPMWFVTVLGPLAPARDTQDWLDTATSLLAYRATFQVTDQVLALGEDNEDDPYAQDLWRADLKAALKRW